MPGISVIIPAYNSEKFISETLDSLLNQTMKDIEVIVVNDGSTDGTQKIIDLYKKQSPVFKSITQENAGVSAARNNGLEHATGDYVVFLDADDFFTPDSLEAFYKKAVETDSDIVMGRLRNYTDGKAEAYHDFADRLAACNSIETFDKRLLWSFLVGNKCYKRSKLIESGVRFPDFGFSEEGAFFMSFVYTGATMSGTMDSCMYYRRHTQKEGLSVSQTASVRNINSLNGSMNRILETAVTALEKTTSSIDKEDYIQEIYFKHAHILVSQFYREMWKCDEKCLKLCSEQLSELKTKLTPEKFVSLCKMNPDLKLENLLQSKAEIKDRPEYSIIIDGFYDSEFFASIYNQTAPLFEVIVTERTVPLLGEKYRNAENLKVAKSVRQAKKLANSKKKIVFRKPCRFSTQTLKTIHRFGLPSSVLNLVFPGFARILNLLLLRREG